MELVNSINALAERLSQQRREAIESQLLVSTVIAHIDVAIIALNASNHISFLNPAARKLLLIDESDSTASLIEQLSFVHACSAGYHQVVVLTLGNQQGRFHVHVEEFRESGLQNKLLFITDVRTLLRNEESNAWQNLLRVISHEINNSLSPIASISETLAKIISTGGGDVMSIAENKADLLEGLTIIKQRANGLNVFVGSYRRLTKLPAPTREHVSMAALFEKVRQLFKDQKINMESAADIELFIDPVQFEQVLINLIKNAIEAMHQAGNDGEISVSWGASDILFKLKICDEGCGISNKYNLFTPFYSTKRNGSGIGLVLSRQIVESHNGYFSLANRDEGKGCCASIELPLDATNFQAPLS